MAEVLKICNFSSTIVFFLIFFFGLRLGARDWTTSESSSSNSNSLTFHRERRKNWQTKKHSAKKAPRDSNQGLPNASWTAPSAAGSSLDLKQMKQNWNSDRSCWELIITTTSHGTSRFVSERRFGLPQANALRSLPEFRITPSNQREMQYRGLSVQSRRIDCHRRGTEGGRVQESHTGAPRQWLPPAFHRQTSRARQKPH